jgi:hypothetical protein
LTGVTYRFVLECDVSAITRPDDMTVDALARLQLVARQHGLCVRFRNAGRELLDLLIVTGLADELCVEVNGKIEQLEVHGPDEEVDPGDASF